MRKEMEACAQCEKQIKHIRALEDQLSKCNMKLGTYYIQSVFSYIFYVLYARNTT